MQGTATTKSIAGKAVHRWLDEFKAFAFKGNVVDLAVGVIIGAAFGKIVNSLVKDIIMPVVSLVLPGDQGYANWKIAVGGKEVPYGLFISEVVNFLLVAAVLFLVVRKFLAMLVRHHEQQAPSPPPMTRDQELLTEIRDLLREHGKGGRAGRPSGELSGDSPPQLA